MSPGKSVEIAWYGQAMFRVSSKEATVVIDPTPPETGYVYDAVKTDIVLITHTHFDHYYLDGLEGSLKVISASGKFELGGIKAMGFDTWHDDKGGQERGSNIVYVWEQAGMKLGHLGDLGHPPAHDLVKRLLKLDILMVPVGGVFTIDAEQAARLIRDLEPRIVLPMHYGTPDGTVAVRPLDEFARAYKGPIREVAERPVEIARDSVPSSTEVWVLPYK